MRIFLVLLFLGFSGTAYCAEAKPEGAEPKSVLVETESSGSVCSTCRVRRGIFGRRYARSTNYTGESYTRSREVTDVCGNVVRSRSVTRSCNNNTCSCN